MIKLKNKQLFTKLKKSFYMKALLIMQLKNFKLIKKII